MNLDAQGGAALPRDRSLLAYALALLPVVCLLVVADRLAPGSNLSAVLAVFVTAFFLVIAWVWPELALVLVLALVLGALPSLPLPSVPFIGGSLNAEDLGLMGLLLVLLLKRGGRAVEHLAPMRACLFPLGVLLVIALTSAAFTWLSGAAPLREVLREGRGFYCWLILPVLCLAVGEPGALRRLKWLLLGLAVLVAAGALLESMLGMQIMSKGQQTRELWVEQTNTTVPGVYRSTSPGMFLMAGVLMYFAAAVAVRRLRRPLLALLVCGLLLGGILVGFGRALWLSVLLGVLLLALVANPARYLRLLVFLAVVAAVLGGSALALRPDYASAVATRFLSIGHEVEHGTSFNRRRLENAHALEELTRRPLTGVGLGGAYRLPDPVAGGSVEQRYIHNAYVNVATKLGLPGLLATLALTAVLLWRAWGSVRAGVEDPALAYAAFWVVLATAVLTAPTQPNLVSPSGVASLAVAVFLVERLRLQARAARAGAAGPAPARRPGRPARVRPRPAESRAGT